MKKQRIDAGTDIAKLGAWDLSRDQSPFSKEEVKKLENALEKDVEKGHLFLIETGADCGGPIDVYVDAEAPGILKEKAKKIVRDFPLSVPTGKLVVGGVEDFRREEKQTTAANSIITLPAGDYFLTCYASKDEDETLNDHVEARLEKIVGAENLRYYDKVTNGSFISGILFNSLIFFVLIFSIGLIALPLTIVTFVLYYHGVRWVLKGNERYQELEEIIPAYRLEKQSPQFIFELTSRT